MSNNKQSSIDWLVEKLFNSGVDTTRFIKEIEEATAMHKKEMVKTYIKGYEDKYFSYFYPEEHYNETFGGNK